VLGKVLLRVLVEMEKASRIFFDISVTEIVQLIIKSVLHILSQLGRVLRGMLIELASCRFELIGGCGRCSFGDDFVDAALYVGTIEVALLKQVGHEAHQRLLRGCDEVFVPDDVEWLLVLRRTVTDQDFEETLHEVGLLADEPVPPLGVVLVELELWLDAVGARVAQRGKRGKYIKWVSNADECLLHSHRLHKIEEEGVVGLGDPDIVANVRLTLEAHNLQRCRSMNAD